MIAITGNTYPVKDQLKAMGGKWDSVAKAWMVPDDVAEQAQKLVPAQKVAGPSSNVGDLSRIIALFDHARQHLKYPAIVLNIPNTDAIIRINVAGLQAKHPGTLNVADGKKPDFPGDRRTWYGRVMKDGTYQPSKDAPAGVAERLVEFAKDPGHVAREYAKSTMELVDGVLTGRCCFCNLHLQDKRSTDVGYGKTCAKNYNLPWGK